MKEKKTAEFVYTDYLAPSFGLTLQELRDEVDRLSLIVTRYRLTGREDVGETVVHVLGEKPTA